MLEAIQGSQAQILTQKYPKPKETKHMAFPYFTAKWENEITAL